MAYGLRIWDASGILALDISDRITRVHSIHSLSAGPNTSTFYAESGVTADGSWGATIGSVAGFATVSIESGGFRVMNKSGVNITSLKVMLIQL